MSMEYPGLSARQVQILEFIQEYIKDNDGLPPTIGLLSGVIHDDGIRPPVEEYTWLEPAKP